MNNVSTNNEVLRKTLLNANSSSTPTKMLTTSNLTLPKPICSAQHTPNTSYSPLYRVTTNGESSSKNRAYPKYPSAATENDTGMIALEHCYARPLNWKPDSSFYQPTKLLFMEPDSNKKKSTNPLTPHQECDDIIDVEFIPQLSTELYDKAKALILMKECDTHVANTKPCQNEDDWEDSIVKTNWTPLQMRLFNGVVNILNSDHLARLAHTGAHHEPIIRRSVIEKSVKRMRYLFTSLSWDVRLTQWIHQLLLDHLSSTYLSAYLDILQTLKAKLPHNVENFLGGSNSASRLGQSNVDDMPQLLKRPWDPVSSYTSSNKLRKLPGNPIIIIVPAAPSSSSISQFKRQHKWMNLLANLSTVVSVHTNIGSNAHRLTLINCADQMLTATRAKVQEVKADYNARTIILVGFNAGAALALQVAQVESVFCVVCIGFSVLTAEGKRGDPDDSLLELQCPVLFVIGQCSNTSSQEDIEDLRERMRVENGLIIVGSSDDYLRVNKKKKRADGITQNAVDRLIVESIGEFVSGLVLSPYPPQVRQSPTQVVNDIAGGKRMKIDRKRNNSNTSSLESEPPSPTPKVTRPVGRPPGSKSKSKLEAKWAAQIAQGILPLSTSPPPLTPSTSKFTPNASPAFPPPSEHSLSIPLTDTTITKTPNTSQGSHSYKNPQIDSVADNSSDKTNSAKLQMMGLNRSILTAGNNIPTISTMPNKVTLPPTTKHGIRVLENVSFNANGNNKLTQGTKPGVDLTKLAVLNSMNPSKNLSSVGNVVLMNDGKFKTLCSTVKGTGGTPLLLPILQKSKPNIAQVPHSIKHGITKYITSKKQLLGRKPPYPPKTSIITSYASSLPPPTNLTSQDIMDLPIIFADDNQMLTDTAELRQADISVPDIIQPIQPPKLPLSNPVGKFVFLNKQQPLLQSLTTPALKRPTLSVPVRTTANPVKYTKIILSRGLTSNETKATTTSTATITKITHLSPEISIRRIETPVTTSANTAEAVDLENKLVATAIPKPEYTISAKKEQNYETAVVKLEKSVEIIKRTAMAADFIRAKDDDPDYVPPKSAKHK